MSKNTKYYYMNDNNDLVLFDTGGRFHYAYGTEGTIFRYKSLEDGTDLAIKIYIKPSDYIEEQYEYYRSFNNLFRTVTPKHLLFNYDTDEFAGDVTPFVERISNILDFKCENFLRDFNYVLCDGSKLGGKNILAFDCNIACNYIFGEENLYLLDPSSWTQIDF